MCVVNIRYSYGCHGIPRPGWRPKVRVSQTRGCLRALHTDQSPGWLFQVEGPTEVKAELMSGGEAGADKAIRYFWASVFPSPKWT